MTDLQGAVAPGFERVIDAFKANFETDDDLGAGFAAIRDGEIIVDIWGGHADRARTKPWAQDTLVPVYSATKGVSAIIIARLCDDGLLSYDDKVADLWPEFAAHGKGEISVAQALAHQAGVPGFLEPIDPALWLDPPACAAAIADLAPLWPPGNASGYHPYTWGYIVAELARRAGGRSLGTILREDVCEPLGIDFHIGLAEKNLSRCAEIVKPRRAADFGEITDARRAAFLTPWAAPHRAGAEWRFVELPAANGHGTALALARLYGLYATQGAIGSARFLSQDGFTALTARRWIGDDLVLPFRIDWRTGIMGNSNLFYGPNPDAFGHSGSGGSCALGDPARGVSGAYVMNRQSHYLMGDPRALRLIEALYACLSG